MRLSATSIFPAPPDLAIPHWAADLLAELKQPGKDVIRQIYVFDTDSANRNFTAVLDYYYAIAPERVWVRTMLPVDWQRGLAYRFDKIVQSEYLVFQPVP